jgi:DNA-binding helix-hairpin-helix protein with protein kinase domain
MIDVGMLWQAIIGIPDPGVDPPLPSEHPWKVPSGMEMPNASRKAPRKVLSLALACAGLIAYYVLAYSGGLVWLILALGLAFVAWPWVSAKARLDAEQACSTANTEWQHALAQWRRETSRTIFAEKLNSLKMVYAEIVNQPNERRRRLTKLEEQREYKQRQLYLDRFRINRSKIRGIGSGRTAMLASYGIETAADVEYEKIIQIPGFGESLTSELVQWRQEHEHNFRFNPNEPVEPEEINALDRELVARRQDLLVKLQQGQDVLRQLSQEISTARSRLMPLMEKTWDAYKIAQLRRGAL